MTFRLLARLARPKSPVRRARRDSPLWRLLAAALLTLAALATAGGLVAAH